MTGRALAFTSAFALLGLGTLPACSTETTASTVTVAVGTPTLTITSPRDGACLELTGGVSDHIPVTVAVTEFFLRPPGGACTGLGNCGHLLLQVNGLDNNLAASNAVDVDFQGKISNHFGAMQLKVTLLDDDGEPWTISRDTEAGVPDAGPNGPFTASVNIITKLSC